MNPSTASMDMGTFSMDIYYQNLYVGNGTLTNIYLKRGRNLVSVVAFFVQTEQNKKVTQDFFSQYLVGQPSYASLRGNPNSTNVVYLKQALSDLEVHVTVPGLNAKLIQYSYLFVAWEAFKLQVPVQLLVFNPTNTTIEIIHASFAIYYGGFQGTQIGVVDTFLYFSVPPNQKKLTPKIDVKITGITWKLILELAKLNEIYVDVTGTLTVSIGIDFTTDVRYYQMNIPSKLTL